MRKLSITITVWTIAYLVLASLALNYISPLQDQGAYLAVIASYALVSIFISFFKSLSLKQIRLYSFAVPFVFGLLVGIVFILGMAWSERYDTASALWMLAGLAETLPYAAGIGLLIGLPLGAIGYLVGGVAYLLRHFVEKIGHTA